MVDVRLDNPAIPQGHGSRLNLLLTYGGWRDDSWASRLPRLLQPMGVEARSARCGSEATTLLKQTPIHVIVVDLTLPLDARGIEQHAHQDAMRTSAGSEEGGIRLLQLLSRVQEPPPIIVVREPRLRREDARDLAEALRHGVFAVLDRPVNMELMLDVLRRLLIRYYKGQWPEDRTSTS